jgi:fused signal recognition particle receptor
MGVETAMELAGSLKKARFGKDVSEEEVRQALADEITAILEPVAKPLVIDPAHKPEVILVCGVNGTGKTTTIGKLSQQFSNEGKKVMLAAGDTFRAAAIEQLEIWGRRTGVPVIAKASGADAAGLAFEALEKARAQGADVLLIDTAGRLHNKSALMDELAKIVRVIRKQDGEAPHQTLLVLDATTGQNAKAQVETFKSMAPITGLAVTKLDGTARGGVVVALARQFGLPVHALGVGEGVDDLRPFDARAFADALLGLETAAN